MKENFFTKRGNKIHTGIRVDGRKLSVRENRDRYFFPDEWEAFYESLKDWQKPTFRFLILTGCRVTEAYHVTTSDFDDERNTIHLTHTKTRNKDKSRRGRTIPLSSQGSKWLKKHIRDNVPLIEEQRLGFLERTAAHKALKQALRKSGIRDWQMISTHNIRKTLETWLIALDIDSMKVIQHFGHGFTIASKHYVSADTFTHEEKIHIRRIIGDLYQNQRGY